MRKETKKLIVVLIVCSLVLIGMLFFGKHAQAIAFDVTESCGMNADELSAVLKGELADYADAFLQAEEDYSINALFLVSIAAHESGWGKFQFCKNNIFGYGNKEFDSIEHCIDWVAWRVYRDYIREDGKFYRGGSVEDIGRIYCDEEWAYYIKGIWGGLLNENN